MIRAEEVLLKGGEHSPWNSAYQFSEGCKQNCRTDVDVLIKTQLLRYCKPRSIWRLAYILKVFCVQPNCYYLRTV